MPKDVDRIIKLRSQESNKQLFMNAVINALVFSLVYIVFQAYIVPRETPGQAIGADEIIVRAVVFSLVFFIFNWLQRKYFQNKLRKDKKS